MGGAVPVSIGLNQVDERIAAARGVDAGDPALAGDVPAGVVSHLEIDHAAFEDGAAEGRVEEGGTVAAAIDDTGVAVVIRTACKCAAVAQIHIQDTVIAGQQVACNIDFGVFRCVLSLLDIYLTCIGRNDISLNGAGHGIAITVCIRIIIYSYSSTIGNFIIYIFRSNIGRCSCNNGHIRTVFTGGIILCGIICCDLNAAGDVDIRCIIGPYSTPGVTFTAFARITSSNIVKRTFQIDFSAILCIQCRIDFGSLFTQTAFFNSIIQVACMSDYRLGHDIIQFFTLHRSCTAVSESRQRTKQTAVIV